jgi:hypothetical protein
VFDIALVPSAIGGVRILLHRGMVAKKGKMTTSGRVHSPLFVITIHPVAQGFSPDGLQHGTARQKIAHKMPAPVSSATTIKPEGLSYKTIFYKKRGMHPNKPLFFLILSVTRGRIEHCCLKLPHVV